MELLGHLLRSPPFPAFEVSGDRYRSSKCQRERETSYHDHAATVILASGIVWLSARSHYIPYVVEVDKLGYALTVSEPLTLTSAPNTAIRTQFYILADGFHMSSRIVHEGDRVPPLRRAILDDTRVARFLLCAWLNVAVYLGLVIPHCNAEIVGAL